MKSTIKNQFKKILTKAIIFFVLFSPSSCGDIEAALITSVVTPPRILVAMGIDKSPSVKDYRQLDTNFVGLICRSISERGGLIVVYMIGEPSDKSGLRCYLKPVPTMDNGLVLSKKAELKFQIKRIQSENEKVILEFLCKVQNQILRSDSSRKINNSDINGFFRKVDVLLNEPESQKMERYVFVYSDGIQSIYGTDNPANYRFNTRNKLILCLAGWKTKMPSDTIETKMFEDPEGFLKYLKAVISINN